MLEFESFRYIVAAFVLVIGGIFMFLAAVGVLRLPDLPTRMHASTKAGSLGAGLTVLAVAIVIPELPVIARAIATVVFLLLTAPVAAHVIGRAGYFVGVPLWEGTVQDALAEQYDFSSHSLRSGNEAAPLDTDEDDDPGPSPESSSDPPADKKKAMTPEPA